MASDLVGYRDHCRRMADPETKHVIPVSAKDRALWALLAAEVDAYLAGDTDETPLFE